MAELVLTGEHGGFSWQITDLGSPFNSSNYISAGLSPIEIESGATEIDYVVDSVNAKSSGKNYYTTERFVEMEPGAYYYYGWCQAANGKYYPAGEGRVDVKEAQLIAPEIELESTATTVTVTVIDSGDYRYFKFSIYDSSHNVIEEDTRYRTTTSRFYENLSPNTKYYVYCSYSSNGSTADDTLSDYIYTQELSVDLWDWESSNGSATASQTLKAYNAVTNKGNVSDFSYKVWNDMCYKVYEIRSTLGAWAWDTQYLSYDDTLMSSADKVLTAKRFNSLKYNIGSLYSTGISDVSTGDKVYGSYFTTLMDVVNEWIGTL